MATVTPSNPTVNFICPDHPDRTTTPRAVLEDDGMTWFECNDCMHTLDGKRVYEWHAVRTPRNSPARDWQWCPVVRQNVVPSGTLHRGTDTRFICPVCSITSGNGMTMVTSHPVVVKEAQR